MNIVLTHMVAMFVGAGFGFGIAVVLMMARISDLERDIAEVRNRQRIWTKQQEQQQEAKFYD
jgi:hypothetical protein